MFDRPMPMPVVVDREAVPLNSWTSRWKTVHRHACFHMMVFAAMVGQCNGVLFVRLQGCEDCVDKQWTCKAIGNRFNESGG